MLDKMQLFGKHNEPQPQQRPGAASVRKPGEPSFAAPPRARAGSGPRQGAEARPTP
jgi:hypothetical protein